MSRYETIPPTYVNVLVNRERWMEIMASRINLPFDPLECWPWRGRDKKGYGKAALMVGGKVIYAKAHRISFFLFRGDIEEGKVLDHKCRNRACANPYHLEVVSNRENILRGVGAPANHARKTHCLRGHLLSGANLAVLASGYRKCRQCERLRRNKS